MNWDIISRKLLNSDDILRDENGTLVLEHRMKTIIENLATDEELSAECYDDYIAFDNYINRDYYCYQVFVESPPVKMDFEYIQPMQYGPLSIDFNEMNQNQPVVPPEPQYKSFCRLPSVPDYEHQYVSDVLTRDTVNSWKPGDRVFLSAGTGKGKNTFIKEILLKYSSGEKIVIFENRESLLSQQILDMVKSIDPDALQYQNLSKENMVIFGRKRNIMLISYQKAALKCILGDQSFSQFCYEARYFVFDEIHYILDDSKINKGIHFFVKCFLRQNCFSNSIKLFLSGSMEEVFVFLQKNNPLYMDYRNMADDPINRTSVQGWITENAVNRCPDHMLHMPTDYSYIKPCMYQNLEDIAERISESDLDEKWLVFVESKVQGELLLKNLLDQYDMEENDVKFLHADNKNSRENKNVYRELVRDEIFNCRVLIATTVIYNGVNIKDRHLKHIVLPFTTVSVAKQLIGRKRMKQGEKVSVYVPVVPEEKVTKRLCECIQDYYDIIGYYRNPFTKSLIQLNRLTQGDPDYICVSSMNGYDCKGAQCYSLTTECNNPAVEKLHFDTVYYLFLYQKMSHKGEKAYAEVLLQHLGIYGDSKVENIVRMTDDEIRQQLQKEIEIYLEQSVDHPIEEEANENGKYPLIGEFCKKMNEFSMRFDGKSISSHWQDHSRFISQKEFADFLQKLNIKFEINLKKHRGEKIKTLNVKRTS